MAQGEIRKYFQDKVALNPSPEGQVGKEGSPRRDPIMTNRGEVRELQLQGKEFVGTRQQMILAHVGRAQARVYALSPQSGPWGQALGNV